MISPFAIYVRDISRYPTMGREREAEVGRRRVAATRAAAEARSDEFICKYGSEYAADLASRFDAAEAACVSELVVANLRFVVSIARSLRVHPSIFDDMIQAGNAALSLAAARFDPAAGFRLTTYAGRPIRWAINDARREYMNIIHIPNHLFGPGGSMVEGHRHAARASAAMSVARLGFDDGDDGVWGDGDALATGDAPGADAERADEVAAAIRALDALDDKEKYIVMSHVGLNGDPKTFPTLAGEFGVSKQRAQMIFRESAARMRKCLSAS